MKHRKILFLVAGIVLGLILLGAYPFWIYLLSPFLSLANDPQQFQQWLSTFGWGAHVVMMLCVIAKVICPMLPGKVLEIAAGYCFGFWEALWLVLLANAIGTSIVRCLVKRYGKPLVLHIISEQTIDEFPIWRDEKRFQLLLWLTYLIPGTPKDALTYVVSLSNLSTPSIVLITTIGRTFTVAGGVFSGSALGNQAYELVFWFSAIFTAVSALGLYIYRKYIIRQ